MTKQMGTTHTTLKNISQGKPIHKTHQQRTKSESNGKKNRTELKGKRPSKHPQKIQNQQRSCRRQKPKHPQKSKPTQHNRNTKRQLQAMQSGTKHNTEQNKT